MSDPAASRRTRRVPADPLRLWILPAALVFLAFYIIPISHLLTRSFYDRGGLSLANYAHMLREPIYRLAFYTTFRIAGEVTLACLLIGYPIAYLLRQSSPSARRFILIVVLVPFWTSVLVRTYAFMILLSRTGVVNQALMALGLVDQPVPLLYNETGVIIGMVYVLLPMMILTLYSAMCAIDDTLLAASESLGAHPIATFFRVFVPLSRTGILTGCLLVFLTGLGFFITPALLGGGRVPMLATLIDSQMEGVLNWGMGSALSVVLLATTMLVFALFNRLVGMEALVRKQ